MSDRILFLALLDQRYTSPQYYCNQDILPHSYMCTTCVKSTNLSSNLQFILPILLRLPIFLVFGLTKIHIH